MTDNSTDLIITIAKWTAGVLAAGFIAQFGKRFADWIIERRRRKRLDHEAPHPSQPPRAALETIIQPTIEKNEKKALKAAAKLEKKRMKKAKP